MQKVRSRYLLKNLSRAAYKTTILLRFPHGTLHYRLIYHI